MSRARPGLDRRGIVGAALQVLDERGLDGLSSHAVAARLGVRQPALYHHFRDKADLLAATAAEVLDRWHIERLPEPGEPWDAFLARNARSMRRALLTVRDGARLIASAGSRAPEPANALAQLSHLEQQGFSGPDAALAYIAVARYTIGSTLEQQTARDGNAIVVEGADPVLGTEAVPGADVVGADVVEEIEGIEHLAGIAAAVVELGPDHEFEVGLAALVHGLGSTLRTSDDQR